MNKQEKEELANQLNSRLRNCPSDSWDKGYNEGLMNAVIVVRNMHTADEPLKVKVPEEFDEWYQQIEQKWGGHGYAEQFALWKICQFGFGNGFEDVNNDRTSQDLSEWVRQHRWDAINAVLNGYEVEEEPQWVANEGDLVVRRGEHEAKVYFVESIDEDGILLVNGIKDAFFTDLDERSVGEESINYFYENFRLLAKKESLEVEKV